MWGKTAELIELLNYRRIKDFRIQDPKEQGKSSGREMCDWYAWME